MASAGRVTWQDVLMFWGKVFIVCLILATVAFFIGRNHLGVLLTKDEIKDGAAELVVQVESPSGEVTSTRPAPPAEPEVSIEQREGSDREAAMAAREMGLDPGTVEPGDRDPSRSASRTEDGDEATAADVQDAEDQEAPASEDGRFVVIAGSFANPENSEAMLKELQAKGYRPYITRVTVGDKTYDRVNVGAFPDRSQADALADEIAGAGYETTVGVR